MNVSFDTSSLRASDAQAIVALLHGLFPAVAPQSAQLTQPEHPAQPATASTTADSGSTVIALVPASPVQAEPPAEPAKRTRRTRAEIAADEAQQKAASALSAGVPVPDVSPTQPSQPAQPAVGSPKGVTADELRALLSDYIQKHSLDEAISQLRDFGCNRISEALELEPAKLKKLAAVLSGAASNG